jgi:predicted Fe-S protein YdhL (DUF1289 family)
MNEAVVKSPCINICSLDHNEICMGCHRHANEIAVWSMLTNEQKRKVIELVAERKKHLRNQVESPEQENNK